MIYHRLPSMRIEGHLCSLCWWEIFSSDYARLWAKYKIYFRYILQMKKNEKEFPSHKIWHYNQVMLCAFIEYRRRRKKVLGRTLKKKEGKNMYLWKVSVLLQYRVETFNCIKPYNNCQLPFLCIGYSESWQVTQFDDMAHILLWHFDDFDNQSQR
jgi:hypothetical protein